jgi:outer membrane protein TolC
LTFQAYIQGVITSLMPGFAWSFPGPGKLKARAGVAAAQSQGKYFTFEIAVLQTAFNLKRTYYQLGLLEEQLRLKHESLVLFGEQERTAHAQNTAGSASLADLLRAQTACDRARTDLANLEDSHRSLLENFKAALGLTPDQADPPVPAHFEVSRDNPDADELLRVAFTHNPQLKAMEADVRVAEAGIKVAYKDRVPDFSAALMADVKASPWLYWPQLSMSLPIWRDKLAAEAAGAEAEKLAAQSRLKAAQIDLAVNFAGKSFAYRQTGRNLTLIEDELIPRTRQSVQTIRAGYRTGAMSFSALTDAEQMLLDLQLEAAQTRTDHEIALADLSIMVAGLAPANAPLLSNASQP